MSAKVPSLLKFLVLLSTTVLTYSAEDIVTKISSWSAPKNDATTDAACPEGYAMIGCKLAEDSSSQYADGLFFTGDNNACRARASGSKAVKVRPIFSELNYNNDI